MSPEPRSNRNIIITILVAALLIIVVGNMLAERRDAHNRCMDRNGGFGESLALTLCD